MIRVLSKKKASQVAVKWWAQTSQTKVCCIHLDFAQKFQFLFFTFESWMVGWKSSQGSLIKNDQISNSFKDDFLQCLCPNIFLQWYSDEQSHLAKLSNSHKPSSFGRAFHLPQRPPELSVMTPLSEGLAATFLANIMMSDLGWEQNHEFASRWGHIQ